MLVVIHGSRVTTDLIGAREVARILNVSRRTVTRMVDRGALPAVKVGNSFGFERDVVARLSLGRFDQVDTPLEETTG